MSGKLKEVRGRIKSVKNTRQITSAMKLVAAAKLRRATDRIVKMRPYSEKLSSILSNLLANMEGDVGVPHSEKRDIQKVLLVLVTSDRGLCGGFNANNIKTVQRLVSEKYASQHAAGNVTVMSVGKKGADFFRSKELGLLDDHTGLFQDLSFDKVVPVAEMVINGFLSGKWDAIELVYARFKNPAVQFFVNEAFLPVAPVEGTKDPNETNFKADYIFEPSKEQIVEDLIPKILKTQFYKALLDSNASEQGSRMTAMDNATENATEMLKDLQIMYNKERQAAITKELIEIVSGAAAMES